MKRNFAATILAATAITLSACAGGKQQTAVEPTPSSAPAESAESSAKADAAPPAEPAASTVAEAEIQSSSGTATEAPAVQATEALAAENSSSTEANSVSSADSTAQVSTAEVSDEKTATDSSIAAAPDPYQAFPALVLEVFAYADTLYKAGNVDSATAYLERFRIIKPLWNTWQSQADSLLNEFGKTRAELAKKYEPMVLEIQNMNRANAAYSMVAAAVDSLIAMAPGDSLVNFANGQKQLAYKNTLAKALKEKPAILALAETKAQFDDALKLASEFQMRYRDFEEPLQIAEMIAHIEKLKNEINEADQKFWEENDPAAALAQVDALIAKKEYAKAKELATKLKASKLRKEAFQKYQALADAFCNDKRKATSQLFENSRKQKDAAKKKAMLQEAIGHLQSCNEEYPDYEKARTVMDNMIFLQKELDK